MWVVCKTPSTLKVKYILQENLEILNRTYDHILTLHIRCVFEYNFMINEVPPIHLNF